MEDYHEPKLEDFDGEDDDEKIRKLEAEKAKVKKKRHGVGVQIFYRPDNSIMCKYEGHWDRNQKHGLGITTYPDQSVYIGNQNHSF